MSDQIDLVFLLIYACGALVELLIRISLGVPTWAKPTFEKTIFLIALQPVVFILLPALIWPLVALHHIFRPICDRIVGCCCGRLARKDDVTAAAATTTAPASAANGGIPLTPARTSIISTIHDLEKQDMKIEPSSVTSASRTRTLIHDERK